LRYFGAKTTLLLTLEEEEGKISLSAKRVKHS